MKLTKASAVPRVPVGVCPGFVRALSNGDLEHAAASFARQGCLVTPDATAIHGRERIRPLLSQMIDRQMQISVELSSMIGGGEVVLARERWNVQAGERSGPDFEQTLNPLLVLQRIEGAWKLAIAAPWGWGNHSAS
jgi:ketosteroid isomerase-like protein